MLPCGGAGHRQVVSGVSRCAYHHMLGQAIPAGRVASTSLRLQTRSQFDFPGYTLPVARASCPDDPAAPCRSCKPMWQQGRPQPVHPARCPSSRRKGPAEAIRQPGGAGIAFDAASLWRPWRFPLTQIKVPAHLWLGDADNLAPAALGRLIADAIPGCEATICPGEGHAEPLTRHADEIMATMAD